MATINYNGMELEEFKPEKPEVFLKPRKALCWDGDDYGMSFRSVCNVFAVVPYINLPVLTESRDGRQGSSWYHCALLPDPPKPRRATNRELSRWLAQGKGECMSSLGHADTAWMYEFGISDAELVEWAKVRKWSDTEWHEPTVEYLGIDDKDYNFNKKYGEV